MTETSAPACIQVFVDGSSQTLMRRAGIGVAILNEDGYVLAETARSLTFCSSLEAELRALLAGLEFAESLGIVDFLIATDCLNAVHLIRGNAWRGAYDGPEGRRVRKLVIRVRDRMSGRPKVTLTHIPREMNEIADRLAVGAARQARRYWAWDCHAKQLVRAETCG